MCSTKRKDEFVTFQELGTETAYGEGNISPDMSI